MQGQANHFRMQATGDSKNVVPYGIKRYHDETVRLYTVLEAGLEGRDYLVGDGKGKYSLADMIIFPWALWYRFAGVRNDEVGPNVKAWIERIKQRPAVQRGLEVPTKSELLKNLDDVSTFPMSLVGAAMQRRVDEMLIMLYCRLMLNSPTGCLLCLRSNLLMFDEHVDRRRQCSYRARRDAIRSCLRRPLVVCVTSD